MNNYSVSEINNDIERIPKKLINFLTEFFTKCGETEHLFINNDVSIYFDDINSLSCKYAVKRLEYYLSFRPFQRKPVINLNQIINFYSFESNNNIIKINLSHSSLFSYAEVETNSGIIINYCLTLTYKNNNYFITLLEALDDYFYGYINHLDKLDEEIKLNNNIYNKSFVKINDNSINKDIIDIDINEKGTMFGNNILINRTNVVNYSYVYTHATGNDYNRLFGSLSADCQNFASQCIWAGLGGSDTPAAINSCNRPMDTQGSYNWYNNSSAISDSWQNVVDFSTYIASMNLAPTTESGLKATQFNIAIGSSLSSVPSTARVGSVAIGPSPTGSPTSFGHAMIIVKSNGDSRSDNYANARNPVSYERSLDYEWSTTAKAIAVISVGSYQCGTSCTHVYTSIPSGSGVDAVCNLCGFVRLTINPGWLKPVSVGSSQNIYATFGFNVYSTFYRIYSLNANGTRLSNIYTSSVVFNVNNINSSYTFSSIGLYEIEFIVNDCAPAYGSTQILCSMRIRVRL